VFGLLVLVGVVGSTFALEPDDSSRTVAERFAHALDEPTNARLEDYLAPDAQVFLQGAPTGLSPVGFRTYLDQLRRSRHAFRAASSVYLTRDGAGWLLEVKNLSQTAIVNEPGIESPPQLWMQGRIGDGRITRLWVHFTVEALARLHTPPDRYRASAEARDIPLPVAWQDGTEAMLQAAERGDPRADASSEWAKRALLVVVWTPLLIALAAAAVRALRRHRRPERAAHGQLLARLAQVHSASLAVGASGPGESTCLAQRGWGATCAVDLEHNGARRLGFDTPASVNDDRPGAGASPEPVADQLVIQA
jgi:hypothetical protein